jgi:hypothetical protein
MNTVQAIAHILKIEGIEWVGCFPSNNLIEPWPKRASDP